MGTQQSKTEAIAKKQKDQAIILFQAGKTAKQLNLFNSDREYREQQHLLARVQVYGHSHLIEHLKTLPKQSKFNFIRYLRQIDFETMDFLYQNYIQNRMRVKRDKQQNYKYQKIAYIDKKQQHESFYHKFRGQYEMGEHILRKRQVGIVLFVGGNSTRFNEHLNNKQKQFHLKQLYTEHQNQKSLLQIKLDEIQQICQQYGQQTVYLIHNELNIHKINKILSNYKHFTPKKILQNQNWILSLSGKLCLRSKENHYLLQAPSGCGDFLTANYKSKKVIQDMKECGLKYLCCVGIENILERVLDPYLLGIINNGDAGVVYKCTYPENQNESAHRILYNPKTKQIQIKQIEHFLQNCHSSCIQTIKRSPIWANSCIIRISAIEQSMAIRLKSLTEIKQIQQIQTVKKIKKTYYHPKEETYLENQYCYVFERELSDLLMSLKLQMQGVMIPRENQYMPVISIQGEKIWRDAYQEYVYQSKERKQQLNSKNGQNSKKPILSSFVKLESKIGDTDPHQLTNQNNDIPNNQYEDSLISLQKDQNQY